jgi:MraZ protein
VSKSGNKWDFLAFCGLQKPILRGETAVFRGVQHINMDAKGRLAMPARQRDPLVSQSAGQVVVTIDTQSPCLVIYPVPEWERIEKDIQSLPTLKPAVKRFQRLVLGYATDLELDSSGRLLLPQPLRDHAQLDKKLVLVGQGNKLELWSEALWLSERDQALRDSGPEAELPDELMSLTL